MKYVSEQQKRVKTILYRNTHIQRIKYTPNDSVNKNRSSETATYNIGFIKREVAKKGKSQKREVAKKGKSQKERQLQK